MFYREQNACTVLDSIRERQNEKACQNLQKVIRNCRPLNNIHILYIIVCHKMIRYSNPKHKNNVFHTHANV